MPLEAAVDHLGIWPNIGDPVDVETLHAVKVEDLSLGHLAYGAAFFASAFAKRLADPASLQEIVTFSNAEGRDLSGCSAIKTEGMKNLDINKASDTSDTRE